MSKFEDVRNKLDGYCAGHPEYRLSVDEKAKSFLVDGGGKNLLITIKGEKVECPDPEFLMDVTSYVVDQEGYVPAVIDETSKKDLQSLMGKVSGGDFSELKIETVRDYLCPKATTQEFLNFLLEAKVLKVNPFAKGEFYFIKNAKGQVYHHVGVNTFIRRAHENPDFIKYDCGVIVAPKGAAPDAPLIYRKGELFVKSREELVGGWCKAWLRSRAEDDPVIAEVSLDEYDTGQSNWARRPATMIVKVAKAHCLRAASPRETQGMYLAEELGVNPAKEVQADFAVQEAA